MVLDPLSTAIASEVGKVVIKTTWDGSGKVLGMLGKTADAVTQKLIYQASQTYVKKIWRSLISPSVGAAARSISILQSCLQSKLENLTR